MQRKCMRRSMPVLHLKQRRVPFARMIESYATLLITHVVYLGIEHFFAFAELFRGLKDIL